MPEKSDSDQLRTLVEVLKKLPPLGLYSFCRDSGLHESILKIASNIEAKEQSSRIQECVNAMAGIENPVEWMKSVKALFDEAGLTLDIKKPL